MSMHNPGTFQGALKASIGTRLRRARARAELLGPLATVPYILPAARVDGETVQRGEMRTIGGNVYLCVGGSAVANVSGSTGTGTAPSSTSPGVITDGTVSWVYCGKPLAAANDAGAPALTLTTAPNSNSTFTALTKIEYVTPTSAILKYLGVLNGSAGYGTPTGGSNKTYPAVSSYKYVNGTMAGQGGTIQFETDAPKLAVDAGSASTTAFNFRISVDSFDGKGWRYITQSAFAVPTGLGDPQYGVLVDWTATSGRKPRAYRVETGAGTGVNSVRVSPLDAIWRTPAEDNIRALYLSDSWGEGIAGNTLGGGTQLPQMTMAWQFAKRMGITDVVVDAAGGTGYIATNGGGSNTYLTRSSHVSEVAPEIVFVDEACINDTGQTAANIQAAAAATFANLRAYSPTMPIVVFGGGVTTTASQTGLLTAENAVKAAVTAMQVAGDTNIWFVSRLSDPQGSWGFGTGKSSATTGDGNSDLYTTSDGAHRTDVGHDYEGRRLAEAFANYVLPLVA